MRRLRLIRPRVPGISRCTEPTPRRLTSLQYKRTATSKYQVRRISITSYSRASAGGND
jgi:hypothetical protein